MKELRIYPGIGIARVGNSDDSFFLSPEILGLGPLELRPDGVVEPVVNYKDAAHKIRRQAARFRVYEVDISDVDGSETYTEVIAAEGVSIEWTVELANEKAAAGWFTSVQQPEDPNRRRNPEASLEDLTIKPTFPPIAGVSKTATATVLGRFKGTEVYLGELRTDDKGRLLVLGGRGASASIPAGQLMGGGSVAQGHPPNTFANNWAWHDDVSDGPVTAIVHRAGQPDERTAKSSWVIVAPPDFAPHTQGLTTLYDIAAQAGRLSPPALPSFQRDILPILQAAAGLRFVSALPIWQAFSTDYALLGSKGTPAADQARQDARDLLLQVENAALHDFSFTDSQKVMLAAWAGGNFAADYSAVSPSTDLVPANLDRASLSQTVGGGFFPGIEAGIRMTSQDMYSSPFRVTGIPFNFAGVQQIPRAGFITRTMACPWQSDFFECEMQTETSAWWPAQRPIDVFVDPAGQGQRGWAAPISTHADFLAHFWQLGFVKKTPDGSSVAFVEDERDPGFPR